MNNSTAAAREVLARLGGPGTVIDQHLWGMMTAFGVISAGFAIQVVLTLRAEESGGRAEPILAAPVTGCGGRVATSVGPTSFPWGVLVLMVR
jgi:ABC-2 type transport system permease protein